MVDYDYPIVALVRGLHRTDLSARWVVAVVAHQQYGFLVMIVRVLGADVHLPDPVDVPTFVVVKRDVVLGAASIRTCGAILGAPAQVDHHTPPAPRQGCI
jgi:hypothetical protein